MNLKQIFQFYILNINISVNIYGIALKSSVSGSKLLFEGRVSQIFVWVSVLILCQKLGNFMPYFRLLRHASLHPHLNNTCLEFGRAVCNRE